MTRNLLYQDRGRGDPYPLESLFFLLQNPSLAGAAKTRAYNDECKKKNFGRVLLVDQKDVLAYLTGKTDTSQYLVSIDELASITAQPDKGKEAPKQDGEKKRQREDPKIDMNDETIREAKRQVAEMMELRPLVPSEAKTAAERKLFTKHADVVEPTKNAYVVGDQPVTRSLVSKERLLVNRSNFLHGKTGHEFKHLIELVRVAFGSGHDRGSKSSAGVPGQPQRRDRYNVDAKDAYKAAGIDSVLLSADKGSLLTSEPTKGPGDKPDTNDPSRMGIPIIIVPAAPTSLVNMFNIKELLEKGNFKTREERKAEGAKKEDKVVVQHVEEGWTARYKIVESPEKQMKKEDWGRVVAVFVQGPEWQFKGWDLTLFDGKIVNMMNRIAAFHVEYEKDPRHANIPLWQVKVISIHKTKRHMDEKLMNTFWDTLKKKRLLAVDRRRVVAAAKSK